MVGKGSLLFVYDIDNDILTNFVGSSEVVEYAYSEIRVSSPIMVDGDNVGFDSVDVDREVTDKVGVHPENEPSPEVTEGEPVPGE